MTPFFWSILFTYIFGAIGYLPWVLSSYEFIPFNIIYTYIGGVFPLCGVLIASRISYGKKGPSYNFGQLALNIKQSLK